MSNASSNPRTRTSAVGLGILAAGLVVAVWRSVMALRAAQSWFDNRAFDPSAAELDAISFWMNCAGVALGGLLVWVGRRMLRRG